jgi:hypothetical protein
MAVITSGKTFANGEQLSADKLNQVITAATFASGAIDPSVMQIVGDAITIADGGVATAKIADSNVTKAKIENVANMKVLGNTSGGATSPQEVAILDEDNMSTDSDTSLATQQSIKAYVDTTAGPTVGFAPTSYAGEESVTLPNGLIMKMGLSSSVGADSSLSVSFGNDFQNAVISVVLTKQKSLTTGGSGELTVNNVGVGGFTIRNGQDSAGQVFFQAIGY